jgi:zinc transporter ZupT
MSFPEVVLLSAIAGAGGLAIGLLSIVWLTRRLRPGQDATFDPSRLAMATAVGLGLHNLSEGLAIGASAATGATTLALILVIGFALHNATEGFGIAAPLASGARPSWRYLGTLGLIGGGPTFLGGIIGFSFTSALLATASLGLAAGALIYVFNEMVGVSRRASSPMTANTALLIGLLAASERTSSSALPAPERGQRKDRRRLPNRRPRSEGGRMEPQKVRSVIETMPRWFRPRAASD